MALKTLSNNIPPVTLIFLSALYALIFLPPLYLFSLSIERGMEHIDLLYPYPQSRTPLYAHPYLIYTHIYLNILSLGLLFSLLSLHPPTISKTLHSRLAWLYTTLLVPGTISSVIYASHQSYGSDAGKAGTFAFGCMALATFYTLSMTLFYQYGRKDIVLHRAWALRNFAVLFGNGVVFRVLANSYLMGMEGWGADFYATWCQMIWMSWVVPLLGVEGWVSWERSRSNKLRGKGRQERSVVNEEVKVEERVENSYCNND